MKVAVGNDHRGYALKKVLIDEIKKLGHEVKDFGSYDENPVDYPDYAFAVTRAVVTRDFDCGILICGSGLGMCIAASRIQGIRAARCQDCFSAKMARLHNDSNILCLGSNIIGPGLAVEVVQTYLKTGFEGGRHAKRLEKIEKIAPIENAKPV